MTNPNTVRFGDMVHHISERVDPAEAAVDIYIGLGHLDPEQLKIRRYGEPSDVTGTKLHFYPGDIIFGKRRYYQKKLAVAEVHGICSAHAMVLRAKEDVVLPEFLPFFMQSQLFYDRAMAISVGSLSPTINWTTLKKQEFPLPPLDEQRRIAEVLWAVEAEMRALGIVLDDVRQVEFSLGTKYFKSPQETIQLGQLVEAKKLELQTGPFGTVLKASSYVETGIPIVNPVNMEDGVLITEDGPFVSKSDAEKLSKYLARFGDTILGRKGEVGRAVYINPSYDGYIIGSDIIRVRPCHEDIDSKYLYYFFRSEQTKLWLMRYSSGTTMPGINERILARLPVPIFSQEQQRKINSRFAQIDTTRNEVLSRLEASHNLKAGLLHNLLEAH